MGLCRELGLFAKAIVAIDGSKFKAVNARERHHTRGKLKRRIDQVEQSISRYLQSLDMADARDGDVAEEKVAGLREKVAFMKAKLSELKAKEAQVIASPDKQISQTDGDARFDRSEFIYDEENGTLRCPAGETLIHRFTTEEKGLNLNTYWSSSCPDCTIRSSCTTGKYRRIKRWEHEAVIENMLSRLNKRPDAMTIRRQTVEHVFGTLKSWMGPCHFLTKGIKNVATEMSLSVLAYNIKRLIAIMGVKPLITAIRA